ncbi:hypothetical protein M9H77_10629 [Catharanthus roseus]|uniref:Uncharacterized protein n=1 Tax=Catharanthus roseus TaxID=4058 RepID=A0ACC0BC84_CATRO|nr:hypothetical protein M9H77_10629 [Catharanthus roseus]
MDTAEIEELRKRQRDLLNDLDDLLSLRWTFASDTEDEVPDLMFLRTYLRCSIKWGHSSFGNGLFDTLEDALADVLFGFNLSISDLRADNLLERIHSCKPMIKEDCLNFLASPHQLDFYTDEQCSEFVSELLNWKLAYDILGENMYFLNEVFELGQKWYKREEYYEDFKIHFQGLAWRTGCLLLVYWVHLDNNKEENMEPRMDAILSDFLEKSSPIIPDITRMCIGLLTSSKPPAEVRFQLGKLAHKFVQLLSENLQVDDLENDGGIQMLFMDLIFFITFLMDRQKVEDLAEGKLILTQVNALLDEVVPLISSLRSQGIKEDIAEKTKFLLHTFLEKANLIKTKVRKICAPLFQDQPCFNFHSINVSRHIDSLLEGLEDSSFSLISKHSIMMLREELVSFKESKFENFSSLELQNKHKEIKHLWIRIVEMTYNAERAANSLKAKFLWHDILHYSDVVEEVKLINGEMKRIKDQYFYDIKALNSEKSVNTLLPLHFPSPLADKVVGFNDEMKEMIDRLTEGSKELDILSIVGMPGAGKTTLARKVYALVQHDHFHRRAWCTVSQTLNNKRMFLDILKGIGVTDDLSNKKEEDLAEKVYKSLKGQKYLIVLDDIWDVRAWDVLKLSFPDDNVGSRIIITSRIHDLVSKVKSECVPLTLRPLSAKESWELLEKNLFDQNDCPTDTFVDIGTQIATKCMGLPLAVVLIAGLLKKDIMNLDWWRQVGERLDKLVAIEDCKGILEESYKQLPDNLKPCFLYFGSFPGDEKIRVNDLIILWISEGFIEKHETKSLEVVANEYLMDLVVPPSIKKLANLETLIFEQYSFYTETDFPLMAVLEMQKLRHLFVRGRCDPTGFQNNKHPISPALRTFSCTGLQLPYERSEMFFRKLPNVQTLKCQIKSPYSLREEPKLILKLDYLSRLEALRVHYRTLADKLASFELQFPNTLKKLHLLNFSLPWSSISAAISRLPNLEVLKLDGGFFGETWNVEDHEFQTLKFLRLKNLPIEEFNASDDSFPCLQHFVVDGCEDLQEIPIRFARINRYEMAPAGEGSSNQQDHPFSCRGNWQPKAN